MGAANLLQFFVVLSSLVTQQTATLPSVAVSGSRTETLWRGALDGDSVFVRASWVPTAGSSWCAAVMGCDISDLMEVRPKYLEYRIEDARARMLLRDEVSGEDFGACIDGMFAQSACWRDGLLITITASRWGCEPAGYCELKRYVYIVRSGHIAMSEWTSLSWDPSSNPLLDSEVDDRCLTYSMTLAPEVRDSTIVFAPTFSSGVREGALLEKPVSDDVRDRCRRWGAPREPTRVDWFTTPEASSSVQKLVGPEDQLVIRSVVVRAKRDPSGVLRPVIFRVGVELNGQRGFLSRAALRRLGFELV